MAEKLSRPRVNYDEIAPSFDRRYSSGLYDGLLQGVTHLIGVLKPKMVLDVGCGTGYWLHILRSAAPQTCGLDYSRGMLARARERDPDARLVRGRAELLPFTAGIFDLIFCLNAVHHFTDPTNFIGEARRVLTRRGALAIIGMDPHHGHDHWYVYDFFPETKALDQQRYLSSGSLTDSMLRAGFDRVECREACRFASSFSGAEVFTDPELHRHGCSQLALLSDAEFEAGMDRIRATVKSEAAPIFSFDIRLMMQIGYAD